MTDAVDRAKSVFLNALEIQSEAERAAYLQAECGDNTALRREVDALLDHAQRLGGFLADGDRQDNPTADQPMVSERPGAQIGPYKLLQELGEGGMGMVFLAEQKQPVQRRVALKIIKPGMDTRQVIARFEAEEKALAVMDHPNIARVLDAGTTDSGRPYFVMELVKGIPVTKYCDEQHLTPRERLELFIPICHAVQHAHQKGIIHRDIKPSNILVTLCDGKPVPKVIDFGVAKAVGQKLTEKTVFTASGQIIGTLEYMSPEQANLNQLDIDTRSDIYSLGVLLYELLTGVTPLDRQQLKSAALDEMMRIIREEEPARPSARLSTIDTLPSVAANRHIEPKRLTTLVRGELDWIVMKALEKDRARRYETANGFADDIQRYLNDEPVEACPPSAGYRVRKYVRRHKTVLATGAIVALALVTGTAVASWQAVRARYQAILARQEAERADQEADRAKQQAEKAATEAAIAKAVNDFLSDDLLAQADPENQPNRDVKLRTILDRASATIENRFQDQPLVAAAIHVTLATTYKSLGEYDQAQQHSERSLQLRRDILGTEHADTLKSMNTLACVYTRQARHAEAEELHKDALEARRRTLGNEHPDTLASMNNLAWVYTCQARYEEAEKLDKETLEARRRTLGDEHPDTLQSMHNIALWYSCQRRYEEAEKLHKETLEIQRRILGKEHPNTLDSMRDLALAYSGQRRYEEAEKLHKETLEIRRRILGTEHPYTLASMQDLALMYSGQGRYAEAEKLWMERLEIRRRTLGNEHPNTLRCMNNLAWTYQGQGRYEEAEKLLVETLESTRRTLGKQHPDALLCMNNLAIIYRYQARYEEAEKLLVETLEICQGARGKQAPETTCAMNFLARTFLYQGRYAEAERTVREAIQIVETIPTSKSQRFRLAQSLNVLAWIIVIGPDASARTEEAVATAARAVEAAPHEAEHHNILGIAQYRAGNWTAALESLSRTTRPRFPGDASTCFFAAMAHWQLGNKEDARQSYDKGVACMDEFKPKDQELQRFRTEAAQLLGVTE
ncbi:MAG: serine/threonine protein kinase [Planctomycetes bacterium]|nr:serine/threonine protein kinase [Planctomycetota bacterium]